MKKTKKWWEDDWDKLYKERLSDMAVEMPNYVFTFNDYAKQRIQTIVDKEIKMFVEKYNLFSIAKNRELEAPHEDEHEIDRLLRHFRNKEEQAKKVQKSLKTLKSKL